MLNLDHRRVWQKLSASWLVWTIIRNLYTYDVDTTSCTRPYAVETSSVASIAEGIVDTFHLHHPFHISLSFYSRQTDQKKKSFHFLFYYRNTYLAEMVVGKNVVVVDRHFCRFTRLERLMVVVMIWFANNRSIVWIDTKNSRRPNEPAAVKKNAPNPLTLRLPA